MNGHNECFVKIFSQIEWNSFLKKLHDRACRTGKYWPTSKCAVQCPISWTVPMVSFVWGWNGLQYQSRPEVACGKATHAMHTWNVVVPCLCATGKLWWNEKWSTTRKQHQRVKYSRFDVLKKKSPQLKLANGQLEKYLLNVLDFDFAQ